MIDFKIMDGAMGSELIRKELSLPEHIWSAEANIKNPDIVKKIHGEYIYAGSDYITANTFRTTPRAYLKTGASYEQSTQMAKESLFSSVELAKEMASNSVNILGSIAPLEDCYMPECFPGRGVSEPEFAQLGKWLTRAGVDILLLETMNSIIEAESALIAIEVFDLPIWVSFVLKDRDHLLSGDSIIDALKIINQYPVDCVFLNCNTLDNTIVAVENIVNNWHGGWGIYPKLGKGKPSTDGNIVSREPMEKYLTVIKHALDLGASIVGACCGSTPEHIAKIREL